jgi:hypothetical protein
MAGRIARVLLAVCASVAFLLAAWGFAEGVRLFRLDSEGGSRDVGLILIPSAVVIGLVGLAMFALSTRR